MADTLEAAAGRLSRDGCCASPSICPDGDQAGFVSDLDGPGATTSRGRTLRSADHSGITPPAASLRLRTTTSADGVLTANVAYIRRFGPPVRGRRLLPTRDIATTRADWARGLCEDARMVLAEILVAHQDRTVVRVGDAYIKVETDQTKAEREHAILRSPPVPVPEVLWWRPGSPSLLALARVSGETLDRSTARDDWVVAGKVMRTFARGTASRLGAVARAWGRPDVARRRPGLAA